MPNLERRRSDRLITLESDEVMAIIYYEGKDTPARLLDFSKEGALLGLMDLLIGGDCLAEPGDMCDVALYHDDSIFQVKSKVMRKGGSAIAFEFVDPSLSVMEKIESKYDRLAASRAA